MLFSQHSTVSIPVTSLFIPVKHAEDRLASSARLTEDASCITLHHPELLRVARPKP
jgi:hypothetical protein